MQHLVMGALGLGAVPHHVLLSVVQDAFNVINVDRVTFQNDMQFHWSICFTCSGAKETEAQFTAGLTTKLQRGTSVRISMAVDMALFTNDTTRETFVSRTFDLVNKYQFTGIDVLPNDKLPPLDTGDTDFSHPRTAVVLNFIAAFREIKAHFGPNFTLTFTTPPSTFQSLSSPSVYQSSGALLPVLHALRDDIVVICQGLSTDEGNTVVDSNGVSVSSFTADYWVALARPLLQGFNVAGNPFPAFAPEQVCLGWRTPGLSAKGPTATEREAFDSHLQIFQDGITCIMQDTACNTISPSGEPFPNLLGVAVFFINDDAFLGGSFARVFPPLLDNAQASTSPPDTSINQTGSPSTSTTLSPSSVVMGNSHGLQGAVIAAIIIPVVALVILAVLLIIVLRRRRPSPDTEAPRSDIVATSSVAHGSESNQYMLSAPQPYSAPVTIAPRAVSKGAVPRTFGAHDEQSHPTESEEHSSDFEPAPPLYYAGR
ncbi:hypothetical protein EXIGLDRAFT_746714 [Exidia glandulosa HHB12029]|uniref:Chitinase n=1 Tax=Exidia glandulosa HHB12029 TaxID=1314781 RepID=A0A165LRM0_EXIGL|nr:hypothetical protein EXIGLDRAFT_746714 [Exidia glandulosa HHB12029]